MIARTRIEKAWRAGGKVILAVDDLGEIRLGEDPRDLALLAGLLRAFPGRDRVECHELRGLAVEAEAVDEGGALVVRALGAPAVGAAPGPAEISAARVAFFRAPLKWHWGRRPTLMRVRDGEVCEICGKPAEDGDHIDPVAHGGEDEDENRRPLCAHCNRSAGARVRLGGGQRVVEVLDVGPRVAVRILVGDGRGRVAFVQWEGAERGVWRVWLARRGRALVVVYWESGEVVRPRVAVEAAGA